MYIYIYICDYYNVGPEDARPPHGRDRGTDIDIIATITITITVTCTITITITSTTTETITILHTLLYC